MPAVTLWGWDDTNKVYRKILVDDSGKLSISDADPFEIIQGTPADLKHSPQTYDPTTPAWRALASNALGHLLVQIASLASIGDIDDVNVAAPTDGYVLYWDETAGKFQLKAIVTNFLALTDTPAAYTGEAGKYAKVNVGEDALEFATVTAPTGFEEIGDTTLTESAASIEFAGIAAGYAAFLLLWHDVYGDNIASQELQLTFNSDGGNNYDYGNEQYSVAQVQLNAQALIRLDYCGDTDGLEYHANGELSILNRASQEKITSLRATRVHKAGADVEDCVAYYGRGKWRNVADEISTITITPSVGNFVAGSRIILLGVKT